MWGVAQGCVQILVLPSCFCEHKRVVMPSGPVPLPVEFGQQPVRISEECCATQVERSRCGSAWSSLFTDSVFTNSLLTKTNVSWRLRGHLQTCAGQGKTWSHAAWMFPADAAQGNTLPSASALGP